MDDPEQERCCPAEVEDGDSLATGVLDETGESAEKSSDAKTNDDRDDYPDMSVKVRVGSLRGHGRGLLPGGT
jgi:hypothetical protein